LNATCKGGIVISINLTNVIAMNTTQSFPKIDLIEGLGYQKVIKIFDPEENLKAYIAIHDTTLGPALGGIRIYPYANEEEALKDVLRLAKGMTYKSALAGCGLGGGKSVIMADPSQGQKTKGLLQAFAKVVDSLKGEYICAEDVGCNTQDVAIISEITPYVVGLDHEMSSGDPSIFTAFGTYIGLQSSWAYLTNGRSLENVRVLVQGLGSVGEKLVEWLYFAGAKVFISDIDHLKMQKLKKKFGVIPVDTKEVYSFDCDIFSPCAMGAILNAQTISQLRCQLVAGCANNQLLELEDDLRLKKQGILYAPDFVINSGGLINVSIELNEVGYHPQEARKLVAQIPQRLKSIYTIAAEKNIGTQMAANFLAEERILKLIDKRQQTPFFHHQRLCKI
jgi:leucine dehydrogenase